MGTGKGAGTGTGKGAGTGTGKGAGTGTGKGAGTGTGKGAGTGTGEITRRGEFFGSEIEFVIPVAVNVDALPNADGGMLGS